jgi:hypothetical protein
MSSHNWIKIALVAVIGIAIGLVYGWVINPVQYTDVTPDILRADYRADFVLMVAEAYQTEQDTNLAARRLAILGVQPPAQIVSSAIEYARQQGFSQEEMNILQELLSAMQTYQPVGDAIP